MAKAGCSAMPASPLHSWRLHAATPPPSAPAATLPHPMSHLHQRVDLGVWVGVARLVQRQRRVLQQLLHHALLAGPHRHVVKLGGGAEDLQQPLELGLGGERGRKQLDGGVGDVVVGWAGWVGWARAGGCGWRAGHASGHAGAECRLLLQGARAASTHPPPPPARSPAIMPRLRGSRSMSSSTASRRLASRSASTRSTSSDRWSLTWRWLTPCGARAQGGSAGGRVSRRSMLS